MEKESKKKTSMKKRYMMAIILVLSTSIAITFVSMLISTRNIKFIVDYYLQFIVSSLFIFALFVGISYTVDISTKNKDVVFRNITIVDAAVSMTVLVSIIFKVFINDMAVILIFPALLIAILMDRKVATITNIMTALIYIVLLLMESIVLETHIAPNAVIACVLSMLSGMLMILLVKKNYSRYKMIFGSMMFALMVAIFAIPVSILYTMNILEMLLNAVWLFAGEVIALALYTLLLPLFENIFHVYTDFKLAELASFSHPMLLRLRKEAPGTFNHSLVVANLAESCAIAVGEDPYFARVGAYYHDVGKLNDPKMFVENQDGTYNPHDELIPEFSASVIRRHAEEGYKMLKNNNFPEEIARIAIEHHGTSPIMFFYMKAQKITEGKLSMSKYCYAGPKPTTKISAIIMICDTVEAAVRSRLPKTEEELRNFVKKMIKDKMDLGQFDDCDITFQDLKTIEDDIVETIPKIYHKRIDYSKEKK